MSLEIIYKGEQTVDMRIYNDTSRDRQKFELNRGSQNLETWVFQSESGPADWYYSDYDSTPPFSSHTYTILSYWSTNGTDWLDDGTDIKDVDTSLIHGTLHNNIDWQIILDRDTVYWDTPSAEYTVSFVEVVDGDLGIYNTTVRLNDSTSLLKAISPGTITADGATFISNTSVGPRIARVELKTSVISPLSRSRSVLSRTCIWRSIIVPGWWLRIVLSTTVECGPPTTQTEPYSVTVPAAMT